MADPVALLQRVVWCRAQGNDLVLRAAVNELEAACRAQLPTDPLLAASCMRAVSDGMLVDALSSVAVRAEPLSARAKALVVGARNRGKIAQLVVELSPGGRGVWTEAAAGLSAQRAAEHAIAAALGADAARYGVRWQLAGDEGGLAALLGADIGLALGVAARAAVQGRAIAPTWGFAAEVAADGTILGVDATKARLRAARSGGVRRVMVGPRETEQDPRLSVHPTESLDHADALLGQGDGRGRGVARLLWLGLAPALALAGATRPLEEPLHVPVDEALHGQAASVTALITLPVGVEPDQAWKELPEVVANVASAGATAVVLDLPPGDADALSEVLRELPVTVHVSAESPVRGARAVDLALVAHPLTRQLRAVPAQQGENWAASVAAAGAHTGASPRLEDAALVLGSQTIALRGDRVPLTPVQPPAEIHWSGPYDAARDRVVLVGQQTDPRASVLGPKTELELHAASIDGLVAGRQLPLADPLLEAAFALLTGALTLLTAYQLPTSMRWLAWSMPALFVTLLVWSALTAGMPAFGPVLLAGGVALAVARRR
jgi:hypothetical protein